MFSDSITENAAVQFMEIVNEGNPEDITNINNELTALSDVASSFIDVSHPVVLPCNNESGMELYTLVGVPKEFLSALNLSSSTDRFLFLPSKDKNNFAGIDRIEIEETLYVDKENGTRVPELVYFDYAITGFFEPISWDLFPESIVFIDEPTALEIARGMQMDSTSFSADRVIAYVPDVSKMQAIREVLTEKFPNSNVRYALKYTGQLPEYATVLIAISGLIVVILFVFCFINIQSSVKQMLLLRHRDIGLLSLFGMKSKEIRHIFVLEFIFSGLLSFLLASLMTGLLFGFFIVAFSIDLLSDYYLIYLATNLVIAVVLFVLIALVQVGRSLKRINQAKLFKEILK